MQKIIEELRSKTISAVVGGIVGLVIFAFGDITSELVNVIAKETSPKKLLATIAILILSNLLTLYLLRKERNKHRLKYAFGLLWDKEKTPHCNTCKNPLGQYKEWHTYGYGFQCTTCDEIIAPTDTAGNNLSYEEVLTRI